jgi:glycosyltransferase involved in cell wall biosynthesis
MRVRRFEAGFPEGGGNPPEPPEVSVVVPTFNEAGNVEELLRRLAAETMGRVRAEVLFVDDSTDDTAAVIAAAAADCPLRVVLVQRERPEGGLGGAVVIGLKLATAPWAVVMDGDLQHPPSLVPVLHGRAVESGADLVVATRYTPGGSRDGLGSVYRLAVSGCLTALAAVALRSPVSDVTDPLSGFFAVRLSALRLEEAQPLGYKVLIELIVRFDLRHIEQVAYEFGHRLAGESKSGTREGLRYLRHLGQLWRVQQRRRWTRSRPLRPASVEAPPETARLSVLVVTSEAPPVVSGISRCVDRVAAGLRDRGHRVDVISSVQIPRFMIGEYRFSAMLLWWPLLARRFRQYDVINLHGPVPTLSDVFLVLWRLFASGSRPIVYTHHSALAIRGAERLCEIYNRVHRRLSTSAALTMVTSQHYADEQQVDGGPPVRVVPWGVDMRAEPLRDEGENRPLRVLFVGQMRGYKGVDWLLPAVAGAPELELRLVGGGAELESYRRLAERIGATNARFLGRVPDEQLHAEYDRSDVIVLPSVTQAEAFGLVVVEGMAAGCVPVVSDLPGVRDVVAGTGLTVPPRDHGALRAAFLDLAGDRDRLAALRQAARARAKELNWDTCVSRYEEAFRDAVGGRQAGGSSQVAPLVTPSRRAREMPGGARGRRTGVASARRIAAVRG